MVLGKATTSAASNLFQVNANPQYFDEEKADLFHHITMQLMYSQPTRTTRYLNCIVFPHGRVKQPDVDDYRKLARVVKYLPSTVDLMLKIASDGSNVMKWWVDASFVVHPDMKGHTGGTMSLGKCSIYSTSNKQRLVARSSTESELVGAYDVLPQIIWMQNFLKSQGHAIEEETILYQDNMSAMLPERHQGGRERDILIFTTSSLKTM